MDDRTPVPLTPEASARLLTLVTWTAVGVAAGLVALKLVAYAWTGSVAMFASAVDSALDVAASTLNLIAVRHALQPADEEHRFGHGKAEALAGLGQSALVLGSAAFLALESVRHLFEPHRIEAEAVGIAVALISTAATVALVLFQRSVARRTRSLAVAGDSAHYMSDVLANAAVLVAFVAAAGFGLHRVDAVAGLLIVGVIAWSAIEIFRSAYDQIMDRELSDEDRSAIARLVRAHPDVRDLHDLRTRMHGTKAFIQFHLELDPAMTLRRAHDISDEVEEAILRAFPQADVIVHQDPTGHEDRQVERLRVVR